MYNNSMLEKKTEQLEDKITEELVAKNLYRDTLDLSIRHFTCIQNISQLRGLKSLNLGFNKITSIAGLSNLV